MNETVSISGIQLSAQSLIAPNRLAYFQAGNGNQNKTEQNITVRDAVKLAIALTSVPRFAGLMAFALPGSYSSGPLPEHAVELSLLIREGLGVDDLAFIHFIFPNGLRTVMNAALLLKAFSHGWANGIQVILLENFMDGGNPVVTVASVPVVQEAIDNYLAATFKEFEELPPAFDQFAPLTNVAR